MIEEITNFLALSDRLSCGGMPTAGQIGDVARQGVQVVINLAIPDSDGALRDEARLVQSLGMEYVSIPVQWNSPNRDDLERFMGVMDDHNEKKILVHCQANYRATAFIALYRVRRLGWEPARAMESLRAIWNPDEYPIWKEFIAAQMGDSTGTRSGALPPGPSPHGFGPEPP